MARKRTGRKGKGKGKGKGKEPTQQRGKKQKPGMDSRFDRQAQDNYEYELPKNFDDEEIDEVSRTFGRVACPLRRWVGGKISLRETVVS